MMYVIYHANKPERVVDIKERDLLLASGEWHDRPILINEEESDEKSSELRKQDEQKKPRYKRYDALRRGADGEQHSHGNGGNQEAGWCDEKNEKDEVVVMKRRGRPRKK